MKNLKLFALLALIAVSAACGGGGGVSGPSGSSGDSSQRALMSVEIWQGGIPGCGGPACDGPVSKLNPNADGSYTVQMDRKHAFKLNFNQPGITGRRIQGDIIATLPIFGGQEKVSTGFNESAPSGVFIGYAGEFTIWGGSGAVQVTLMLRFTESGMDMGSPNVMSQDIVLKTIPRQ